MPSVFSNRMMQPCHVCNKVLPTPSAGLRPPLKKSLFPVQRAAIIMASREAAKSFFIYIYVFPLYRNGRENAGEKKEKSGNVKKNVPTWHL